MLSFYFPLWVTEDHGAPELVFSATLAISMIAVAMAMPVFGALSDATGQRMRYLRWTTFGCLGATVLIGWLDQLWPALALFAIANFCYQLSTVFYDALLWRIAKPEKLGHASGFGAAFGYLGSMTGLLFLWPFVRAGGHQAAFIPSAVFFLLFALPSFWLIRDERPAAARSPAVGIRQAMKNTWITIRNARAYPALWRFFIASFFSLNAINTILVFMAVFTKRVLGFDEGGVIRFFLWGQAFAVLGALVFSRIIPHLGSKHTLMIIWAGWIGALAMAGLSQDVRWMWIVAPIIGFCLGSTWSTSRVLIIELSPKEQLAEFLGLAGLLGRASSIFGPLLWGLLVLDPANYRHAVLVLMGLLAIGLWLLRRVPDPQPVSDTKPVS